MASRTVYSGTSALLRGSILVLVFISVILIFTAPGVCFTRYINNIQASNEICPNDNFFPMNVDKWRYGVHFQQRGQK
ncbi:unnamed protein product [Anisakis simplex]|uniref:Col_cuticle_N domain-containing protein n=1 Tax=Anisakis simplex TaxID=6269 RepID=A0A0M3J9N6_ANISI|nr:unnamed protein product [Anisakis simplex]